MALPIQGGTRGYTLNLERPRLESPKLEAPNLQGPAPAQSAPGTDFAEQVKDFVGDVNQLQKTADTKTNDFATGKSNDIHGTMIAVQEADIALRMVGNFRNRIVEMYREVMRMGS
jgi:flagellar hook-basal body complex protein FliE